MFKEIKCTDCGRWEPYPAEYLECNAEDQAYLEDGYQCNACWERAEYEGYSRQGMAEMIGSGLEDGIGY